MTRLDLLVVAGLVAAAAAACGGGAPPVTTPAPTPNADSIAAERAKQDSLAREQARQDSIRAAQEAERIARQRAADSAAAAGATTTEVKTMLATMIHFDFDKSDIKSNDAGTLDQKVAILQANPALRIRISGHCDERGSAEYNLALGNRRGNKAKEYLVQHGIDAGRIETVSYGEERPIAQGHDETAWSQNRRDEFEVLAGGDVLKKP
ncbi:MAG TPA: peptidoglycan-associated lipoprotein Pal [Gemmatimonadales bacterium]|nr:peptidoglycan-associated lipoprotein Pal [Gemmatimonadales bacterium]